jgi:very-short-patch-repair endonuclease
LDEAKYIVVAVHYYAEKSAWGLMTPEAQHVDLCACVAKRRKRLVFTGQSACAIYGIPRLDDFEMRPHCVSEKAKGTDFIRWRYGTEDPNAAILRGTWVVSPARAVCDLAKFDSPGSLLVSINYCLNKKLFTKGQLREEIARRPGRRWKNVLERLLRHATGQCESPLETIAWAALYEGGYKMPRQQVDFYEDHVHVARVDMYWKCRGRRIVFELDGKRKYSEPDVLFDEKVREDKLREMGFEVFRATWKDVYNGALIRKLTKMKIPKRRYFGKAFPQK